MQKGESLKHRAHDHEEARVTWPVLQNKHKQNEVSRTHAKVIVISPNLAREHLF